MRRNPCPPYIPTPPEGYLALAGTSEKRHIEDRNRPPSIRGVRQPLRGVLVYAEREWKPVLGFRGTHGSKIDVGYTESKAPGATGEGVYMQRLPAERIAVDPIAHPKLAAAREDEARRAAERAEFEAGRAEREAALREERARVRAEERERARAAEAARTAAMDPHERLAHVRRRLAVAQEMVLGRRETVEQAQQSLAEAEELAERLAAQEAEIVAAQGEYQ